MDSRGPRPFFGHIPTHVPCDYDVVQVSRDSWGLDSTPAVVLPLCAGSLEELAGYLAVELEDSALLTGATLYLALHSMQAHRVEDLSEEVGR